MIELMARRLVLYPSQALAMIDFFTRS